MRCYLETDKQNSSEYQFLEYLLKDLNIEAKIECVGGWNNIKKFINEFKRDALNGERSVIIFDADRTNNGGGFDKRRQELLNFKNENDNIDFDLFLMPNNSDDGDFETIILKSVNKKHKHILDCFDKFQECVKRQNKNNYPYKYPNDKSKLYSYKEILRGAKNGEYWEFDNTDYWDFNNDYVKTLKEFLSKNNKE